jgi:N-methylhydantoinase A
MKYRISVDTGGTFTDVIVRDETGDMTIGKALTTPERIYSGMRGAILAAAEQLGLRYEDLLGSTNLLIYGTTRATNAIVTKRVAKTAFVTTAGFPDTLLLKEGGKFNPHDFSVDYSAPYIPRRHTFELNERIGADGSIVTPLDEEGAREIVAEIGRREFGAVAVSLIWSIANPVHEARFAEILAAALPDMPYTLSHQLLPVVREYRRASATAIDASLKPLMQGHLREMEQDLRAAGFNGDILISTSAGGCSQIERLVEKPIYTIGSGPAMAPIAARAYSQFEGLGDDVIVCDTGGTTFDVGLVRQGRLTFTRDTWLDGAYTGNLLGVSAVDMRSIGAGGGSIAWIDEGGLMRVGPQSAGAEPGPACYGRGGTLPTVSDAAAVLGYFNPDYFLGGRMTLDVAAARRVVGALADEIGQPIEQVAYQILSLASDLMMRAIADVTVNEGFNPRESTIVAGGGAAGINIMKIAKELGCDRVVLPKVASALSASGMQFADIVAEETRSVVAVSDSFDRDAVNAALDELEARLDAFRAELADEAPEHLIEFVAEARYPGQVWEVDTLLPVQRFRSAADVDALVETFHQAHERIFAVRDAGSPVEVINWKARLIAKLPRHARSASGEVSKREATPRATRGCYFGDVTPVPTAIFKADDIAPGNTIRGPAIIEEPTTTLVVFPGMTAEVSQAGNYLLHLN